MLIMNNELDLDFYIPVYIINLKDRYERKAHCVNEFKNRTEFEPIYIEAVKHEVGAVGLWESIVNAVKMAVEREDELIIICEDDHLFTQNYSKEYLMQNIVEAYSQQVDILSGGIGGFGCAVPVAKNRFWIDWFWSTQFIVVYEKFFQRILDYQFKEHDTADGVFSALTLNKMTIYPPISIQKDFGYSDVTLINKEDGMIKKLFDTANNRLAMVHNVYNFYICK